MKKERMFGNAIMRLAACVAMVFACAGSAWGDVGIAPVNPAFKQWQKEHRQRSEARQSVTNGTSRSRRLLASGSEAGELGFAPGTFDSSYLSSINVNLQQGVKGGFDRRHDLRDHSVLTPVRNQNPYGTCWAHATCASLESWLLKSGIGTFDFSENNMANLHGGDWGFDDGGNGDRASAYLLRWGGPVLESEDPYANPGGSMATDPARHVQNVRWIPGRTAYLDNDAIKQAIVDFGATYVTYFHSSSYYKSSTASYYFYGNTSRNSNHAVAVVGWDDDYPASKFGKAPPGNGAFIVRNSWGSSWGEDGYFYVSYYDESFAWQTLYSFSNAEPADNYDSIYEYDSLGLVSSLGYRSVTAWGANMFQAAAATRIAAVGFYAMTPNATYTIYVYTGSAAGAPRSGTLATTQNGKASYAGYVTVPLASPVSVSARQRFSVVVQLTTPGYNYPLAYEYAYPGYTSDATASSGQSFLSSNGSSWSDFTDVNGSANFCCKAYAKAAPPPKPTLSAIAISGVTSLTSGQSAQFSCEATYSDGLKKTVSPTWSIARTGQAYATVSASGLVTAKELVAQQTVTVQASYTEDGVTKDADWGMYVTIAAPSVPTDVTATLGTEASCVRVNWAASSGATEYAVYRATANSSKNAQYLDRVTVPRFNDTTAIPGVDYWYFIKAKNSSGTSGFSAGANGWRKLVPPESVTASDTLLDKVALEWSEVEGAKCYRVYRAESIDGEKVPISGWLAATAFDDDTATVGVTYFYFVVAAVDANGSRPSDYSIVEDGIRPEPVTIDCLAIKGDASIVSGGQSDYTADAVYTDKHKVEGIVPDVWEIVAGGAWASVAGGHVTAATVTENKSIVLKATYADAGKTATGEKTITVIAVKPVAPRNAAATATAQGVTLMWNAVAGAASYVVYRDGGVVGRVVPNAPGNVPATTYTDSSAIPGVTYSYTVSAANGAGEGPQSSPTVMVTIPLAAPAGVTATTDRTDGVLVSWQPVTGATHYRVARAASDDGAKTELGSWTSETLLLDTTASVDSPLYYFVRAATSSAGANAGDWSASVVGRVIPTAPTLLSLSISGPDRVAASGSAVYSCTAAYDDGTTVAVAPTWSVTPSGAAEIDSNGSLTARAVSSDVSATVTAGFEGISAAKSVRIVAPPPPESERTATISNVRVKPRWPFSTLVDIDCTLATTPTGTRAIISLSGRDNDHNVPMAAKTLTGDAVGVAVAAGDHRLMWDIGADYPGFHTTSFDVTLEAVPYVIAAPANVSASQGTSTRGVNLSWDAVEDATGYEIWRASGSMNTADAVLVTNVEAAVAYEDTSVNPGDIYFYWFKTVTQYGTGDFSASVFGYRARVVGTVAFDANGGTASASSLGYTAGSPYGTLPTASRTGYEFAGWFTSATGGSEVTAATPADENIATLYAHWTPHTYTIHFDANGGTGTMVDMAMTYGRAKNLFANSFSRTGYYFAGWAMSSNGNMTYKDMDTVSNLITANGGIVTLYAIWNPTSVVALNKQGGSGGTTSVSVGYGSTMPTIIIPTRTGYIFGGYYTSTSGEGEQYYLANGESARQWNKTDNITLYAKWTPITYTVKFNANRGRGMGAGTMQNQIMKYAQEYALSSNKFWSVGATSPTSNDLFVGWATNSTGDVVYRDGATVKNLTSTSGDVVTLYAVWSAGIPEAMRLTPNQYLIPRPTAGETVQCRCYVKYTDTSGYYEVTPIWSCSWGQITSNGLLTLARQPGSGNSFTVFSASYTRNGVTVTESSTVYLN